MTFLSPQLFRLYGHFPPLIVFNLKKKVLKFLFYDCICIKMNILIVYIRTFFLTKKFIFINSDFKRN